jgi:hypothetical protein
VKIYELFSVQACPFFIAAFLLFANYFLKFTMNPSLEWVRKLWSLGSDPMNYEAKGWHNLYEPQALFFCGEDGKSPLRGLGGG